MGRGNQGEVGCPSSAGESIHGVAATQRTDLNAFLRWPTSIGGRVEEGTGTRNNRENRERGKRRRKRKRVGIKEGVILQREEK